MNNELFKDKIFNDRNTRYFDQHVLPYIKHGNIQFSNDTGKGNHIRVTLSLLDYLNNLTFTLYCNVDNGLTLQGNDNEITDYYSTDKQLEFIKEISNIVNNNSNGLYIKGTVNLKHFILLQDILND